MRCLPSENLMTYSPCPSFRAPLLRKFTMEGFSFGGIFGSSRLSKLNEINLTWVSPDTVTSFLKGASSECSATVSTISTPGELWTRAPGRYMGRAKVTSQLKALSVIQMHEDYDEPLSDVLDYLTLPNAEKLVFIDDTRLKFPVESLLSMFARSELSLIKLSHLELSGYHVWDHNLLKILARLPSLAFFAFKDAFLLDEKPHALTARFFQGIISADVMPKLTQLELISHSGAVPMDDLLSFIESRRPSLEGDDPSMRLLPLKQVRIGISSPEACASLMNRLSGLCSGGLLAEVSEPWDTYRSCRNTAGLPSSF
ncbi:hypothetical protein BDP27DRAFT_397196 [Rhodocollybia butyracea]|uniref:Uncharacterized protein n=1 Tax=Rhodocollybia butyracea TaxID=206335 RepID=A0A9P5UBX3_9AGAR|nr:hypothetical protein BDP27DRAFT_397196 [Rhodocollybia butyracea]